MNGLYPVGLALMLNASERDQDQYQQNPLTTREMYAVQPNRSVVKTLLSTVKDKLARR